MPSTSRPLAMLCLSLILAGAALPWHRASALALGEIATSSSLGAPFEAVIPLVARPGELEGITAAPATIKVELGSPADYARLGAERTALHSRLQISLEEHAGVPVVRLRTREPVLEPFLDLVLAVRMPQGRLVRGYTVLIDPPPARAATTAVAAPHGASAAVRPARAASVPARSAVTPPAPLPLPAGTHLTRAGDSLWRIARDWSDGRAVNTAMDAIIAANPAAFADGDPGRLREGVTLTLPGALPAVAAAAITVENPKVAHANVDETKAENAKVAGTGTRLELVAPTARPVVAPAHRGYQQRVEGINAAVGELADSVHHARVRLERMDGELRGLLAAYDRQRDTERAAAAGAPVAAAMHAAAIDAGLPRHSATVGLTPVGAGATLRAEAPRSVDFKPLLVGVVLGALMLTLGAGWSGWRGQRRQAADGLDDAAAPGFTVMPPRAPVRAFPPRQRDAGAAAAGRAPSERPAAPVNGFTPVPTTADESVDPAISAGVYLAFGKLEEAEQLLTEALTQQPERHDLQLQLLDIYLQSGNGDAFEQLAAALTQQFGDDHGVLDELSILQEAYGAGRREPAPETSAPATARLEPLLDPLQK